MQIQNVLAVRHILPKAPDEFELIFNFFGYADDTPEMRQHRLTQMNLVGPAGLNSMEDGTAIELVQDGITSGSAGHSIPLMGLAASEWDQDPVPREIRSWAGRERVWQDG